MKKINILLLSIFVGFNICYSQQVIWLMASKDNNEVLFEEDHEFLPGSIAFVEEPINRWSCVGLSIGITPDEIANSRQISLDEFDSSSTSAMITSLPQLIAEYGGNCQMISNFLARPNVVNYVVTRGDEITIYYDVGGSTISTSAPVLTNQDLENLADMIEYDRIEYEKCNDYSYGITIRVDPNTGECYKVENSEIANGYLEDLKDQVQTNFESGGWQHVEYYLLPAFILKTGYVNEFYDLDNKSIMSISTGQFVNESILSILNFYDNQQLSIQDLRDLRDMAIASDNFIMTSEQVQSILNRVE